MQAHMADKQETIAAATPGLDQAGYRIFELQSFRGNAACTNLARLWERWWGLVKANTPAARCSLQRGLDATRLLASVARMSYKCICTIYVCRRYARPAPSRRKHRDMVICAEALAPRGCSRVACLSPMISAKKSRTGFYHTCLPPSWLARFSRESSLASLVFCWLWKVGMFQTISAKEGTHQRHCDEFLGRLEQ